MLPSCGFKNSTRATAVGLFSTTFDVWTYLQARPCITIQLGKGFARALSFPRHAPQRMPEVKSGGSGSRKPAAVDKSVVAP